VALTDITAKYTPALSWFYDKFIGDAVLDTMAGLIDQIQTVVNDGGSVLEVGCGGQFAHRLIAAHADITVTGIDLSDEQIARATAHTQALPPAEAARVHFQAGSASDIPFADNSFDVAISIASIKHWPDRRRGIAEMVRVLTDGGLLIVAEADRGCHLVDARRFVRKTHLPAPLLPPFLLMFRTYVAGQGLDLDDARHDTADQGVVDARIERIADAPFLSITGRKDQREET
jgi:ubiquinone/menaquinone biosynthesis C-methylase UbiE